MGTLVLTTGRSKMVATCVRPVSEPMKKRHLAAR